MKQKYHGLNFPKPQIRLYEGHGRELTQPGFMLGAVKIEYIHSRVHVLLSLSLSIYVYIYIYTHVYVCVYTLYIYIYIYIYMYFQRHIHIPIRMSTHMNMFVYIHITEVHAYAYTYVHIYIYTYIAIYIYMHTYRGLATRTVRAKPLASPAHSRTSSGALPLFSSCSLSFVCFWCFLLFFLFPIDFCICWSRTYGGKVALNCFKLGPA